MREARTHSNCKCTNHVDVENGKITLSAPAQKIAHHHATSPEKQHHGL